MQPNKPSARHIAYYRAMFRTGDLALALAGRA